jgi:hypothetical protein
MDKRYLPPPPTYPCGHCKKLIPRVQALRQSGYCQACEFLSTAQALEALMVSGRTLGRMADRGELRKVKILTRVLWRRAEIETMREQMRVTGKGWVGLTEAATV